MAEVIMRIVSPVIVSGPAPEAGQYIKDYTPDGYLGRGLLTTTPDRNEAKRYPSHADALAAWRQTSRTHPKRPGDGKPNRPLTAYHVELLLA